MHVKSNINDNLTIFVIYSSGLEDCAKVLKRLMRLLGETLLQGASLRVHAQRAAAVDRVARTNRLTKII